MRTNWDVLQAATRETLGAFRAILKVKVTLEKYTDEQVLKAVQAVKQNLPVETKPIRTAEFEQLIDARAEAPGDLPRAEDSFYARTSKPKDGLPDKLAQVVLVRKLREVRAQVGFTRIEPVTPDLQGESGSISTAPTRPETAGSRRCPKGLACSHPNVILATIPVMAVFPCETKKASKTAPGGEKGWGAHDSARCGIEAGSRKDGVGHQGLRLGRGRIPKRRAFSLLVESPAGSLSPETILGRDG